MYTEFYSLTNKPFQISSDPAFLWLGEKHKEGLATLRYGVLDNRGFLLLTGDVGTGKTTLINALLNSIGDDVICAFVPDPNLERLEFYNYIAQGFGIDQEFSSKGSFLIQFGNFLRQAHVENKKVLLIIDESQLLTQELLEEIRLLSNIEKAETKLLNIFFVGQNEFNAIISKTQNRAVRQRITINYNIETLSLKETEDYVKHRLKVAGTETMIFTPEALTEIFRCSQGFPRRINVICDHALISGYVKERNTIDGAIINECAKEINISDKGIKQDFYDPSIEQKNGNDKTVEKKAPKVIPRKAQGAVPGKHRMLMLVLLLIIGAGVLLFSQPMQEFVENLTTGEYRWEINQVPEKSNNFQQSESTPQIKETFEKKSSLITPSNKTKEWNTAEIEYAAENPATEIDPEVSKITLTLEKDRPEPYFVGETKATIKTDTVIAETVDFTGPKTEPTEPDKKLQTTMIQSLPYEIVIVRFKTNTADFTEQGQKAIDLLVKGIARNQDIDISINGYTDSSGYAAQNIKLSFFRALIVKKYLVEHGADPARTTAIGMGSQNPIESNETLHGREMNRRVEVEVIKN